MALGLAKLAGAGVSIAPVVREGSLGCWWALILHGSLSCTTSLHQAGAVGEAVLPAPWDRGPEACRARWESQDLIPGSLDFKAVPAAPLLCTPNL